MACEQQRWRPLTSFLEYGATAPLEGRSSVRPFAPFVDIKGVDIAGMTVVSVVESAYVGRQLCSETVIHALSTGRVPYPHLNGGTVHGKWDDWNSRDGRGRKGSDLDNPRV